VIQLLAIAAAAGATYFFVMWVWSLNAHRQMTGLERTNAEIEEARRRENRLPVRQRFREYLRVRGYQGSLAPLLLAWAFGYLMVIAVLQLFGVNLLVGLLAGAPVTLLLSFAVLVSFQGRRRRLFNRQLLQLFTMLAAQLEAGSGPTRALEQVLPSLRDPLRGELTKVLESTVAAKPLVEAMHDMAEVWPSRAMSMFISALDLDNETHATLAPALRQAAAIIQRNEELISEAQAELAQTKMEFYIVAGVIGLLAVWLIFSGDAQTRAAFVTPAGFIALMLAVTNYCWGLFRAWRLFNRVREVL
jgi:Flp pilus assembly protein TadB